MFIKLTILQRREGEEDAWDKWSTLNNPLFIQRYIELLWNRVLCYSGGCAFSTSEYLFIAN